MKSHMKRSPCSRCFAISSWARFSPTSSTPASASSGSASTGTYLIAAQISTSAPIFSLTVSRLRRTRDAWKSSASSAIEHHQARLPAGDAAVAAMGEVEVRAAAGAVVEVLDVGDAGVDELARDHRAQVEHAPVRDAFEVLEPLEHLRADLIAAATDTWADRSRRPFVESFDGLLQDAAGEGSPAAVEHRHAPPV